MHFKETEIQGVVVIEPQVHKDSRGFFLESWRKDLFSDNGIDLEFVQDNHSRSVGGTLRGLHYQINRPQGKLVRVTRGEVFDVAIDLRRKSPTFRRWIGVQLTESNSRMLWIPPGFAHGFYVLSDVAEFQYKCTDFFMPQFERSIRWDDPQLGVLWPLKDEYPLLLSAKDEAGSSIANAEVYESGQ